MTMKLLTTLGRLLAVPFWLAVLVNLCAPFAAPFAQLLYLAGAGALGMHLLQLWLCHGRLQASAQPLRDRLFLLLFGAFYLDALPAVEAVVESAPQAGREPEGDVAANSATAAAAAPCALDIEREASVESSAA